MFLLEHSHAHSCDEKKNMHWIYGSIAHCTRAWNNFWVYSALFFNLPPVLNAVIYSKELLDDPFLCLFSPTLIFGDIVSSFSSNWSENRDNPTTQLPKYLDYMYKPPRLCQCILNCSVCRAIICFYSSFSSLLYLCLPQSHHSNYTEIVVNTWKWRLSLCKLGSASEI